MEDKYPVKYEINNLFIPIKYEYRIYVIKTFIIRDIKMSTNEMIDERDTCWIKIRPVFLSKNL